MERYAGGLEELTEKILLRNEQIGSHGNGNRVLRAIRTPGGDNGG